jgi:hypothetical protein
MMNLAPLPVIPAKAGIQFFIKQTKNWMPAYAGMTNVWNPDAQ